MKRLKTGYKVSKNTIHPLDKFKGLSGLSIVTIILFGSIMSTNLLMSYTVPCFSIDDSSEVPYIPYHFVWENESLSEACYDITADEAGNIYGVGGIRYEKSQSDILLMKLSPKGSRHWYKAWGSSFSSEKGSGITIDHRGNIYTVGTSTSGANGSNVLLVKWDREGNLLWNRTWGASLYDEGTDIVIDKDGFIYTAAHTQTQSHGEDFVLIKWDADGNQIWNKIWPSNYDEYCNEIAVDRYGIYAFGSIMSVSNQSNFLLVKWSSTGNQLWNRTWGTSYDEFGLGIALDYAGNIFTVGKRERIDGDYDHVLMGWTPDGDQFCDNSYYIFPTDFNGKITIDSKGYIYTHISFWDTVVLLKWDSVGNFLSETSYDSWINVPWEPPETYEIV
ncbi:MAG: hypothetical protein ACFFBD_26750, partial [Candidatus Hodarchaeota archaeon]